MLPWVPYQPLNSPAGLQDFTKLRGGESYRCIICTRNPDFLTLYDAIEHESTPEHVYARRQLDRPPSPTELEPISTEEHLDYIPDLDDSPLDASACQIGDFGRENQGITAWTSSMRPQGLAGQLENDEMGATYSDWHTSMTRWSSTPDAHFTVPGPSLPSDPSDMVYDLFGTAAEEVDTTYPESLDWQSDSDVTDLLSNTHHEDLPTPPESPTGDLLFNPWQTEDGLDRPGSPVYFPDVSEEWWPFSGREEALFCLMTAFPRAVFSGKELDVVRWFAAKCNVPGMPPQSTIRSRFEHIIKLLELEPQLTRSELGNYFAATSLSSIIKNEMANPVVREKLSFYPQDSGASMSNATNGQRWTEEVDATLAAPMVRRSLPYGGHQDYFVHEPFLASVTDAATGAIPQAASAFLPVRFFEREGNLFARCHPLLAEGSAYVVDGDSHVELPISSFLLPLPEFKSEHMRYGLPAPEQILGVRMALHPHRLHSWPEPIENPWRKKSGGRLVRSVPVWLYCDDTSGNMSKKWNKHNSFLFTLTGLPRSHAQLPYNVHFLATSNIASPLEMLHEIAAELDNARAHGVVAYDCVEGEEVVFVPWAYALQGDNPMQSELSSHIGMNGKFCCRACHAQKPDGKKKKGNSEAETVRQVADFMQIQQPRSATETLSKLQAQEAIALQGTFSVLDDEARDAGVKDKYFNHFLSILKQHQDDHKANTGQARSIDLLQKLRHHMPERLYNPALFIQDLDANQDTPVEILHVVLLGVVKYFWRDAVGRLNPEGKEILKARINSLDVSGLGLSQLRGGTLVQYAGSLTGRDFRAILQIGTLVLYGLLPPPVYKAWVALSHLGPLVFQQEISDIEDYIPRLTSAIDALLEATVLWTPRWLNKPKFHILLHLPRHIQRFGPAVLFATETFEAYNFVIRLRSIHSNRHAPSHDIARAFSRLQCVRHLVSGGWVTHTFDKSSKKVVCDVPRQAGQEVLNLRSDPEFMSLMGMSFLSEESSFGNFMLDTPIVEKLWQLTLASQCTAREPPNIQGSTLRMCKHVVLKNYDKARPNGFVLVHSQGSLVPAQILEILASQQRVVGLTVRMGSLLPSVCMHEMPGIRLHEQLSYIDLESVVCCLSAAHNCAQQGCTIAQTRVVQQERQETQLLAAEVQHTGNLLDLVLNTASLRSAQHIQQLWAVPERSGSLLEVAQQAVANLKASEAKKEAEKQQKEEEKQRKDEEKQRKDEEKQRKDEEKQRKKEEKQRKKEEKERKEEERKQKRLEKGQGKRVLGRGKRMHDDPPESSSSRHRFEDF
ncbi:hypothetical protein FRC12_010319 [Ceratobasidium sp. 428]|nr:hypothetical protein FRC12_010319 [Ceratobasidium sp. 428]